MVLKWFSDFWNSFKKQPELAVFELPTTTTMLWYKNFEGTKILHWCGGAIIITNMRQTPMVIRTVLRFVAMVMVSKKEFKKIKTPQYTLTGPLILIFVYPQRTGGSLILEAANFYINSNITAQH